MNWKTFVPALLLTVSAHSLAYAQAAAPPDRPWSVEFGIGWDNSISGNINSSGIGRSTARPS